MKTGRAVRRRAPAAGFGLTGNRGNKKREKKKKIEKKNKKRKRKLVKDDTVTVDGFRVSHTVNEL